MSEREKDILKTISEALPKMSEFDKGYFLGVAESKAADNQLRDKEDAGEKAGYEERESATLFY